MGTDQKTPPTDLAAIRADLDATTDGQHWHWAGNVDTGEPYLATWTPGLGRCTMLSIGFEPRSTVGPAADAVRSTAREYDLGDLEELVTQWATDQFGDPVRDARLQLYRDAMGVHARDLAVFEVAPEARDRTDPRVYRGDISALRHPDAVFIDRAPRYVRALLGEIDRLNTLLHAESDHADA